MSSVTEAITAVTAIPTILATAVPTIPTTLTTPRMLVVDYHLSSEFKIPMNIPLLSEEENDKAEAEKTPWSWWVKYDTLYYIDGEGKTQEIEAYFMANESDFKHPDDLYFEERDLDSDEECSDEE